MGIVNNKYGGGFLAKRIRFVSLLLWVTVVFPATGQGIRPSKTSQTVGTLKHLLSIIPMKQTGHLWLCPMIHYPILPGINPKTISHYSIGGNFQGLVHHNAFRKVIREIIYHAIRSSHGLVFRKTDKAQ